MSQFSFSQALLTWFDQYGRHDLPWQVFDNPYKVWVSEIMLQQTQVKTVLKYFDRFIERFPTVVALGNASWEDVAPYWAGLGYYARARNLHKAANQIVQMGGELPQNFEEWIALPGIGRSTAGALMSLGLRKYGVIMDGNVKRVLARFFAIENDLSKSVHEKEMWALATTLCPTERNHDYTQAIMDLGATVCTPKKPLCLYCPMQAHCKAHQQGLENELPFKKTKKPVPIKQANVLLLKCEDTWLWYQRPSLGLWGGLWSLPIYDHEVQSEYEALQLPSSQLTFQIKHSFTHFTWLLDTHCINITHDQKQRITDQMGGEWISLDGAEKRGIPTAMQKIIKNYTMLTLDEKHYL